MSRLKIHLVNYMGSDEGPVIATAETLDGARKAIREYLVEHGVRPETIQYWRYCGMPEDKGICIDYGSYSKFFYIEGARWVELVAEKDLNSPMEEQL